MDLANYTPMGDKENSAFFDEYVLKIYDRRSACGLDEIVGDMRGVVVQVQNGDATNYMAELTAMGPYRYVAVRVSSTHRIYVLQSQPEFPRLFVLEPLSADYEDRMTQWNLMYPLSARKPNARYIGEVYAADSLSAVREALEPQSIRFVYDGDSVNDFYSREHLGFTFLSDYTYNRVGYVDVDIDDIDALGLGDPHRARLLRPGEAREGRRASGRARHHGQGPGDRPHGDADPGRRPRERDPRVPHDGPLLLLGRLQHHGDELLDERDPASGHR